LKIKIPYDQDPLDWWKENVTKYLPVSLLAKKYLSIVAISVPSERLFNEALTIIAKKEKRNRLSPERLVQLLFLNYRFKSNPNFETLMKKLLEEDNSEKKTEKFIFLLFLIISITIYVYICMYS